MSKGECGEFLNEFDGSLVQAVALVLHGLFALLFALVIIFRVLSQPGSLVEDAAELHDSSRHVAGGRPGSETEPKSGVGSMAAARGHAPKYGRVAWIRSPRHQFHLSVAVFSAGAAFLLASPSLVRNSHRYTPCAPQ